MKSLKPALEPKYLHMMSTYPLIKTEPHQPEPDVSMASASTAPRFNTQFGVTAISNLIAQIPDHPVLNIQCQSRDEIKTALTLLFNWTIAQRTKDPSLMGQYLGNLIVAGLSGLVAEWWRHLGI